MTETGEIEILKKEMAELRKMVNALMQAVCPPVKQTDAEIQAEVRHLVRTLGPDGGAKEINRLNRLRRHV